MIIAVSRMLLYCVINGEKNDPKTNNDDYCGFMSGQP